MRRRDFFNTVLTPVVVPAIWASISTESVKAVESTRFPTGIGSLDEVLGGGLPSGLVVVTGKVGSGKSTLLRRIHKAGQSCQVGVDVRLSGPVVCPLTGVNHYVPDRLFYTQFDRPVSLIDDILNNASYHLDLQARLFGEFFKNTRFDNVRDNRLAVITLPVKERDGLCGIPAWALSANFYASVIIRLHRLDAQGRGRIQITKNRNTDFLGGLII